MARRLQLQERNAIELSKVLELLDQLKELVRTRKPIKIADWLMAGHILVTAARLDQSEQEQAGGLFCNCSDQVDHNQWLHRSHERFNRAAYEILRYRINFSTLQKILQTRLDKGWLRGSKRNYAQALIEHFLAEDKTDKQWLFGRSWS